MFLVFEARTKRMLVAALVAIVPGASSLEAQEYCVGAPPPIDVPLPIGPPLPPLPSNGADFVRGEVNNDGVIDLSDAVSILGFLFLGDAEPGCLRAADIDDSAAVDITDSIGLLQHLFLGGPPPAFPYPRCGPDQTFDLLGCEYSRLCRRSCEARWNSVALFFNLNLPPAELPPGYSVTTVDDAREWLDEGSDPVQPGISAFLCNYWNKLSYGNLAFGIDSPRDASGAPLIPMLDAPDGDPGDWGGLIRRSIDANPTAIWRAAGGLTVDGKRWIPSVVLVQKYNVGASAGYRGFEHSTGGHTYSVGDITHLQFGLEKWSPPDAPHKEGRGWWGTLCHEFAHNFLEFGDLYGPQGCTGYWDLLGDNSPPGRMSEVSSALKVRIGWRVFKEVIQGPAVPTRSLHLLAYTTSGEAYKVIPDPENTPHEYFLLEFRQSTGDEVWRPDGALREEGLFITHINDRLGIPGTWLLREAPFFDPEFGDGSHMGATDWTGHDDLEGKVFPQGSRNSFTPFTVPSSNLYGGRRSGLYITDIEITGAIVRFNLRMEGLESSVGWTVSDEDRAVAGRFTPLSLTNGEELFLRNADAAAVLVHRQAQWMVAKRQDDWIGGWHLGTDNWELAGDLDGDELDEIYIRSPEWAGVLEWQGTGFGTTTVQHDRIDAWDLDRDDREQAADLDGDGADEIYIRNPEWAGVVKLIDGRLRLLSRQESVGARDLDSEDEEFMGRFRQADRDEVAIRGPDSLGLLAWNAAASRLEMVRTQNDWVDGWNLGTADRHSVGDFDGDGLDEIYIRSDNWAGLLGWQGGRFRVVWMTRDLIEHVGEKPEDAQRLASGDRTYAGRFRVDRDAVLHRDSGSISILAWTGDAMKVHVRLASPFSGRWNLGAGDGFVLGDFHRLGPDTVDAPVDYVMDGLTDVFIHNGWGTGMAGVNYEDGRYRMALTWIHEAKILNEH